MIRGMITVPDNFRISETDAAIQSVWQAALVAARSARIYKWPLFATVPEYIGTETTYEENPVSYLFLVDGRYRWRVSIAKSLCFHKAAFTHRATNGRVFLIDSKNRLIGTYIGDENGVAILSGFTLDLLNPENLIFNDGSVGTKSPIVVSLADPNEVNHDVYGAVMIDAPFLGSLAPMTDVLITIITEAADEIVVSVQIKCDETPVSGLVTGDFVYEDENGDPVVLTAEETEDGVYVLTGTFPDGTLTLEPAATLSLYPASAYEANELVVALPS
jgi:hypothetical protein